MKRTRSKKNVTPRTWWILNEKTAPPVVALGAMVVVILLTLLFHSLTSTKNSNETTNVGNTNVAPGLTLATADGITLAADLTYPSGAGPFPVVILVHEFGQDRNQWQAYQQKFLDLGVAVLKYDTRGFGQSSLAVIPAANATFFTSMANDVAAAVKFVQAQSKLDEQAIFVLGAGTGANVALIEAGRNAAIQKTVLLSPANPSVFGNTQPSNPPAHVLGIADQSEQTILDAVMAPLAEPKKTVITQNVGRGPAILDEASFEIVRQWLTE